MKPKILFFSGNRAEFGYLLPFFIEMQNDFAIDFLISGGHLLPPWNTRKEIQTAFTKHKLDIPLLEIPIQNGENTHIDSFAHLHQKTLELLQRKEYDYAFVMGDRPESFAFASCVFLHNIPLIHYGGGDITDNAYYIDSNIRHVITKMAHLHFTLSDDASKVVEQLGEESWRVTKAGISTYDYDRLHLLVTKEELAKEFSLIDFDKVLLIFTYHPVQYKSAQENLKDFMMLLRIIEALTLPTIITYPNNDSGSLEMVVFLENATFPKHIKAVKNLGTTKIMALYKHTKAIVVGNSSGGVLETVLFKTPTLNIGDRQGNRKRSANIFDVNLDEDAVAKKLHFIVHNYDKIKEQATSTSDTFGDGNAASIVTRKLQTKTLTKEKLLFKKFNRFS